MVAEFAPDHGQCSLPTVAIVGNGALGSIFTAALVQNGVAVALIGRQPGPAITVCEPPCAIRSNAIPVTADPSAVSIADFVLILVKAYDTEAAVARIAPYLQRHATVVSLQNGLGNVERIRRQLPPGQMVLGGVTSQAARRISPGLVLHTGQGLTRIGYRSGPEQAGAQRLVELLNRAGLPAQTTAHLDHAQWQKLAINSAINGPTAIARVANGEILRNPHLLAAAEALADESAHIAAAHGVVLSGVGAALRETLVATASNRSSMLQDIEANRRTEVDAIYGEQIRASTLRGVSSPALTLMDALVRAVSREDRFKEDA